MQKIVQFGKVQREDSAEPSNHSCLNCLRLQAEIAELRDLLEQRESLQQRDSDSEDYDTINIKAELIDIRQKYGALERDMQKIEQQNDDLFTQNTQLQKKLELCTLQLQGYDREKQQMGTAAKETPGDKNWAERQTEKKQLQVSLFVEREKVGKLEAHLGSQNEEIVKLKQLLRKRGTLQVERHQLLEQASLQGV